MACPVNRAAALPAEVAEAIRGQNLGRKLPKDAILRILKAAARDPWVLSRTAPSDPHAGELFLVDARACRAFRRDGHRAWLKPESHARVFQDGKAVATACYAHSSIECGEGRHLQRRIYRLMEQRDVVAVHYFIDISRRLKIGQGGDEEDEDEGAYCDGGAAERAALGPWASRDALKEAVRVEASSAGLRGPGVYAPCPGPAVAGLGARITAAGGAPPADDPWGWLAGEFAGPQGGASTEDYELSAARQQQLLQQHQQQYGSGGHRAERAPAQLHRRADPRDLGLGNAFSRDRGFDAPAQQLHAQTRDHGFSPARDLAASLRGQAPRDGYAPARDGLSSRNLLGSLGLRLPQGFDGPAHGAPTQRPSGAQAQQPLRSQGGYAPAGAAQGSPRSTLGGQPLWGGADALAASGIPSGLAGDLNSSLAALNALNGGGLDIADLLQQQQQQQQQAGPAVGGHYGHLQSQPSGNHVVGGAMGGGGSRPLTRDGSPGLAPLSSTALHGASFGGGAQWLAQQGQQGSKAPSSIRVSGGKRALEVAAWGDEAAWAPSPPSSRRAGGLAPSEASSAWSQPLQAITPAHSASSVALLGANGSPDRAQPNGAPNGAALASHLWGGAAQGRVARPPEASVQAF